MKRTILVILAALTALAILHRAALLWNMGREIPILMYHNVLDGDNLNVWQVAKDEFEHQVAELDAAGYTTILPDDIWFAKRGLCFLPRKPIIISFDDGYEGVLRNAEPILAKHGFRAICYLIAGLLGGEGDSRGSFDSGPLLSTNEVSAMASRGTVFFGSHSISHRPIPKLLASEICESRYVIRRKTGIKTRSYCYPHGLYGYPQMYDALSGKYRTALICDDKIFRLTADANIYAIPRISVYGGQHDFSICRVAVFGGKAQVEVCNRGTPMPVRCMLREKTTGRTFISDYVPIWIGKGPKTKEQATFTWGSLPLNLNVSEVEAVVCEQNGLFSYGQAVPAL